MNNSSHSTYLPSAPREWFAVAVAIAGLAYLFGDELWFNLRRAGRQVQQSVSDSAPIELSIENARSMAAALIPDIRRNNEVIVREQVEIAELRESIRHEERELNVARVDILKVRSVLKDGVPSANASSSPAFSKLRQDLLRRFTAYQSSEAALAARKQLLAFREESLSRAEAAHNEILQKKRELEAVLASLEARLQVLQATGVESEVRIDRTKLAEFDESVRYARKRLAFAERLTQNSGTVGESRPAEADTPDEDLESEVDRYFHPRTVQAEKTLESSIPNAVPTGGGGSQ